MAELQTKLASRYKIFKLREALDTLGDYDLIYMDTPPALNFFTQSALIAADGCLVPFDCDERRKWRSERSFGPVLIGEILVEECNALLASDPRPSTLTRYTG